ncbi:MAG: hydroxymethylglutaryl-CoA reductase (NADPH) [Candidatus Methanomethylophilaceae archaeon]
MTEQSGLKNRGHTHADVEERRNAVQQLTETKLDAITDYGFDPEVASKNIENMIGVTQIPLGFAGPVLVNGDDAQGIFLVPMATTEGALLASVSRGMSLISAAGGSRVKIFDDAMTRAPVFRVGGIDHSVKVIQWISENTAVIDAAACATTKHGKLMEIEAFPNGRSLHLRFSFMTGDAMGMNMATIATEAVCKVIEKETGAVLISVSGNMCTDKKPAMINVIRGRGKTVIAEANISSKLIEEKLHTSVESIVDLNVRKNLVGSAMAGSLGFNGHAANMVAALYIATGQDPAQVVEASMTMTSCENVDGNLYIVVKMPSVEVGTVGGGTKLPTQSDALNMIGCKGEGKARKFAEIVAVTVLAGELSLLGAQAAGQLVKAHKELGR